MKRTIIRMAACLIGVAAVLSLVIPFGNREESILLQGEDIRWSADRSISEWMMEENRLTGVIHQEGGIRVDGLFRAFPGDVFECRIVLDGEPGLPAPVDLLWQYPGGLRYADCLWHGSVEMGTASVSLAFPVGRSMRWENEIQRIILRMRNPGGGSFRFTVTEPRIRRERVTGALQLERTLRRSGFLLLSRHLPRPFWNRKGISLHNAMGLFVLGLAIGGFCIMALFTRLAGGMLGKNRGFPLRSSILLVVLVIWAFIAARRVGRQESLAQTSDVASRMPVTARIGLVHQMEDPIGLSGLLEQCGKSIPSDAAVVYLSGKDPAEFFLARLFLFPRKVHFGFNGLAEAPPRVYLVQRYWPYPFPPGFRMVELIDRNHQILFREGKEVGG